MGRYNYFERFAHVQLRGVVGHSRVGKKCRSLQVRGTEETPKRLKYSFLISFFFLSGYGAGYPPTAGLVWEFSHINTRLLSLG